MLPYTSPEEFCWLYAIACIELKRFEGTMSDLEYRLANEHLESGVYPPPDVIRRWFPKPFTRLEQNENTCSIERMQHYWRVLHQNKAENTPVRIGKVRLIGMSDSDSRFIKVDIDGALFIVFNAHKYPLSYGDRVLIHGLCVAEPMPSNMQ